MIPLVNPAVTQRGAVGGQPWLAGPVRWIVVVLALGATLDAAYLTWTSFSHGIVIGCGGATTSGCDDVLTSRWSRAAGLPVALGGLVNYAAILGLALAAGSQTFNANRWLGTALATLAILAAASGLWFTVLQVAVLGKYCYYCLAIHLCGLTIAALVIWSILKQSAQPAGAAPANASLSHASLAAIPGRSVVRRPVVVRQGQRPSLLTAAPVAGGLLALLIVGQIVFPPRSFDVSQPVLADSVDLTKASTDLAAATVDLSPDAQSHTVNRVADDAPTDEPAEVVKTSAEEPKSPQAAASAEEPPALSRAMTFLDGKIKINVYDEAVLGSPEAKYVVLELMDYTCPHCRKMQAQMHEALNRYGDQLAVVVMPVPLELECNKLMASTDPMHRGACKISRVALSVAKTDPAKFVDFHDFLLADPEKPPTSVQTVVRAFHMVDRTKLTRYTRDPAIEARLQGYIKLYSTLASQHQGKAGSFGLPVQIVGDTVLSGDMTSEEMFAAWEKALGIKPL